MMLNSVEARVPRSLVTCQARKREGDVFTLGASNIARVMISDFFFHV